MDREVGLPLSLPPSSIDVRLEVEEAELGRGLVGSLVTSGAGVLVNTCVDNDQDKKKKKEEQVAATGYSLLKNIFKSLHSSGLFLVYLIKKLGISCVELQRELPEAMSQR